MRQTEHVDVQTRNAVASVRGTDLIVETLERKGQAEVFGFLRAGGAGHGLHAGVEGLK